MSLRILRTLSSSIRSLLAGLFGLIVLMIIIAVGIPLLVALLWVGTLLLGGVLLIFVWALLKPRD